MSAHPLVSPESYVYENYSGVGMELLRKAFLTKEVKIPPAYVSVGHVNVQHAGSEGRGDYSIWFRATGIRRIMTCWLQ